jgi:hypothetical protein
MIQNTIVQTTHANRPAVRRGTVCTVQRVSPSATAAGSRKQRRRKKQNLQNEPSNAGRSDSKLLVFFAVIVLLAGLSTLYAATPVFIVVNDTLNVYAKPAGNSTVLHSLKRDDSVSVDFSSVGDDGTSWCAITVAGSSSTSGYVPCSGIRQQVPSTRSESAGQPITADAEASLVSAK